MSLKEDLKNKEEEKEKVEPEKEVTEEQPKDLEKEKVEPEKQNEEDKEVEEKANPEEEEETETKDNTDELLSQKDKEITDLKTEVEGLKSVVAEKEGLLKEFEEIISGIVNKKMEELPNDYRDLIPDNLDVKQKLSWLDKAEAKGLFNKENKSGLEIGKPLKIETPSAVDTGKLTGSQLLKLAYNTLKK